MRAFAVCVLALLAAGCIEAPAATPDAGEETAAAAARSIPWSLTSCYYVVGWSQADPEKLAARLPEGFEVSMGGPLGMPAPRRAILGTEAFHCEGGSGLDGELRGQQYASIWFPVTPDEAHAIEGIDEYYWKEAILVPDEARRVAFEEAGMPVHAGSLEVAPGLLPNSRLATIALDGFGDFSLDMLVGTARSPPDGGEFAELTPAADGGIATWRASFAWDSEESISGRGTIDWPAGTWAADAVGMTKAPAEFHAGVWSFYNGTFTFPK